MNQIKMQLKDQCFHYLEALDKQPYLTPSQLNAAKLREILYQAVYLNHTKARISMQQLDWLTQVTLASLIELLLISDNNIDRQLDGLLDILCETIGCVGSEA